MNVEAKKVEAMVAQVLAEAQTHGAGRVSSIHLTMYDPADAALRAVQEALALACAGTPAEGARLVTRQAPSRYICWNCCGLRFESTEKKAMCPNCGDVGFIIPPEITFALDRAEFDA